MLNNCFEGQQSLFGLGSFLPPPHNNQLFSNPVPQWDIISTSTDPNLIPLVQEAGNLVREQLMDFAISPDYDQITGLAFGENYDPQKANSLKQDLAQGNLSLLPEVQVISSNILGNANGAYASEIDTIFLSDEFIRYHNTQEVAGVLLEEIGHFIDNKINSIDPEGDEGDIFSRLVQYHGLDSADFALLSQEDDTATIVIDGQTIFVEKNDTLATATNLGTLGNASSSQTGWVGGSVPNDYYRFQINRLTKMNLDLVNLQSDVDLKLLDYNGNTIYSSNKAGTSNENIATQIASGTYYIHVKAYSGSSNYKLTITSVPVNPNTDVTGDGKADAIGSNDNGVYIRRSDSTKFLPNEKWTEIGYIGQNGTWFADVTGDGKADAIGSNNDGVYIRRSDGTKFLPNEKWTEIGYRGTYGTFFADVTGDGKADAIGSNNDGVYIRRSDGTKFLPNEKWTEIGYIGQNGTWFADVTGDGKADAIGSNNDGVYIRRSDGTKFLPNEKWTEIGYIGQNGTWFADVTGDGKADAIGSNNDGVYIRRSDGTKFLPNEKWTEIGYIGQNGTWFADVTGDGKADAIGSNNDGVYIRRSNGTKFLPNEKWTEIGYIGTQGTFIGDIRSDSKPLKREEYLTRLYLNSSSGFGGASASRFYEDDLSHGAIDSTDGQGDLKVYSLVGGQIKIIGKDQYGGNYMDVWNPILQRTFRYIHFDSFNPNLKVNSYIAQGDWLGIEGNTGKSYGRHTHVESRLTNGTKENPLITLGIARSKSLLV
ncbi:hypothetical protein PCC9214_03495 [Planktothrix tepida]|uniref:pre-peptidase C-terminal domain-containing protein n=1 Tax=Planktothrix tepida TaxID=1678309 RepID=UPI0020B263B8|nr:pre-peptidase C-terminal domain-containing protein [Planktothrix tepida]CAD5965956.1 hypothetical protein PCC9214_03495 [Planktothrix tepida]